jgi:hypothetical protein
MDRTTRRDLERLKKFIKLITKNEMGCWLYSGSMPRPQEWVYSVWHNDSFKDLRRTCETKKCVNPDHMWAVILVWGVDAVYPE